MTVRLLQASYEVAFGPSRTSCEWEVPEVPQPCEGFPGVDRLVEARGGLRPSSKPHDHPAQTGDGLGAPASAGSASSI